MTEEAPASGTLSAACGDVARWRHYRQRIDLFTLGKLVEDHGGTEGLDLHGANLSDIDLGLETLLELSKQVALRFVVFWSFRKHAELRGCHLECASLWGAHLEQTDFYEAHLEKANLSGAHAERACFERAHLHAADLSNAHLNGANLQHAEMQAADLYLAQLQGADLRWAELQRAEPIWAALEGADLFGARLDGADLAGAQLRGARFTNATLRGVRLSQAQLQGVDFYHVNSLDAVNWYGAFLDRTRMRRDQLGEMIGDELKARAVNTGDAYQEAAEAYLGLKYNFNSIGRYRDAAWAHVKEQRMGKATLRRQLNFAQFPRPRFWRSFIPWLFNCLGDGLTGYGETPQKPLGVAAFVAVVFFPLLYWAVGALPGHGRAFTSSSPSDIDWAGLGDSIIFSLTSFGTLSFSHLQPEGTVPTIIAACEAFTGVLLFALFVFTLGNRMSRS